MSVIERCPSFKQTELSYSKMSVLERLWWGGGGGGGLKESVVTAR